MTAPQMGRQPKPMPNARDGRALYRVLRLLPRGHQTLMRLYARLLGNGDHFWGSFQDLLWRVDTDDMFVSGGVFRTGLREPAVTLVLNGLLASGDVFVDAGANRGYFTLLAARAVGAEGRAVAIEPLARNVRVLHENLGANGFDFVQVVEGALWHSAGSMSFRGPSAGTTGDGRIAADGQHTVTTHALDDIVQELGIEHIDVLKMDIEGAELQALLGADGLLQRHAIGHILLETHTSIMDRGETRRLFDLLSSHGYVCSRVLSDLDGQAEKHVRRGIGDWREFVVAYDPRLTWTENWAPTMWWYQSRREGEA